MRSVDRYRGAQKTDTEVLRQIQRRSYICSAHGLISYLPSQLKAIQRHLFLYYSDNYYQLVAGQQQISRFGQRVPNLGVRPQHFVTVCFLCPIEILLLTCILTYLLRSEASSFYGCYCYY